MIACVTLVILGVILFVILFSSMLRSSSEHRSAIDSAALAAAKDISRIAINTPEFGWVALTSQPPVGSATNAPDGYYMEVRSVNELMGMVRLNLIIANELGDTFMRDLAIADYNTLMTVKNNLNTTIVAALPNGGSAQDAAGNTIRPYQTAERVYLANQAKGSTYVAGSMQLALGGVEGGIETGTPVPQPRGKAALPGGTESNGRYISDRNVPYLGRNFVFGSVSRHVALCDKNQFRTATSAPFQMPSVVRVTAQQQFRDQDKQWITTFVACASAGSTEAPRTAPGALTISFPDGRPPEIATPGDVFDPSIVNNNSRVYQSASGDFIKDRPPSSLVPWGGPAIPTTPPLPGGGDPPSSQMTRLALYDWLRCAGTKPNIDEVVRLQSLAFAPASTPTVPWRVLDPQTNSVVVWGQIPTGSMHIYTWDNNGMLQYRSVDIQPYPYTVIGENQLYSETIEATPITSSLVPFWIVTGINYLDVDTGTVKVGQLVGTKNYDMFVRDFSRVIGTSAGGKHGGERMDGNPNVSDGRTGGDVPLIARRDETFYRGHAHSMEVSDYIAMLPPGCESRTHGEDSSPSSPSSGPVTSAATASGITTSAATASASTTSSSGSSNSGGAGQGSPNPVSRQDDFGSTNTDLPPYITYTTGTGQPRPCYRRNGISADIRFRRQVLVGDLSFLIGGAEFGYVGHMK